MKARRIEVELFIDGKNITADISPYLKSLTYEDVLEKETDTLEIELADRERLFLSDWFPTLGMTVNVELKLGDEIFPCGQFEIDEVTYNYPPHVMRIKANSCASTSELRQMNLSAAWEDTTLKKIAQDIADASNCKLYYETDYDPQIKRAEQSESSRMSFLQNLCNKYDLALKFSDGKLIIFDIEKYEEQEPIRIFDCENSTIKRFSATTTLTEVYKDCVVEYKHGKHDEKYTARATDSSKKFGKTLRLNERVENQAEADRLAEKKLRNKNRDEQKLNLTVVGDFCLLSGNVIELKNAGFYNQRWLINRARHKVGGGYEVDLELTKCKTQNK